jgi:hypothetical protein
VNRPAIGAESAGVAQVSERGRPWFGVKLAKQPGGFVGAPCRVVNSPCIIQNQATTCREFEWEGDRLTSNGNLITSRLASELSTMPGVDIYLA